MAGVFVAIDFETADPQPDSACAVGLVRVDGSEVVRREVSLIRPPRPAVHPACYAVHGLAWADLCGQRPFAAVWRDLCGLLDGADELAAHNAAFDRLVLEACCRVAGLRVPSVPWVCTLQIARRRWPRPASNRLPDVCARLGIPFRGHHEAGADAEACARVLLALRAVAPAAPPAVMARGEPGPGEAMPPAGKAYWYVGREPAPGRADLPGSMRMLPGRPGQEPPLWATHWACEGMAAWVPLPPLVAAEGDTRPVPAAAGYQPTLFDADELEGGD